MKLPLNVIMLPSFDCISHCSALYIFTIQGLHSSSCFFSKLYKMCYDTTKEQSASAAQPPNVIVFSTAVYCHVAEFHRAASLGST